MFRIWARTFKENKMLKDTVIEDDTDASRTKKVFASLEKICYEFDISNPIWLEPNIKEFQRIAKTRFTSDCFIDSIPFDYLEIQIIEEDI